MVANVQVINTKGFIKATVSGVLNFTNIKQVLIDIAPEIEQPGEYEILLDAREAETVLSQVDLFELGKYLAAHPFLYRSRIAFLTPCKDKQQVEFFENVTANRAIQAKVFTDFEPAITWLVMRERKQ